MQKQWQLTITTEIATALAEEQQASSTTGHNRLRSGPCLLARDAQSETKKGGCHVDSTGAMGRSATPAKVTSYAQKYDPKAGFSEGFTAMPLDLAQAPDYNTRGALPHHNEIAVDDSATPSYHTLYRATASGPDDRGAFANQFRWRENTAIAHIQQALAANYHP